MTSTTFNPSYEGFMLSADNTYANAINAASAFSVSDVSGASDGIAGQAFNSFAGLDYSCYEYVMEFDTSSIPDGATISQVQLKVYCWNENTKDYTVEAFTFNRGASLDVNDWQTSTELSSLTKLATLAGSGLSAGSYFTFTENGNNFRNAISTTGTTKILLATADMRTATAPTPDTSSDWIQFYSYIDATRKPQLIVTYTTIQSVSGSITMSGSLTKRVNKSISGTTGTLSGAFQAGRLFTQAVAGSITTLTGAIAKSTLKPISGSLSPIGTVVKQISKPLAGTMGTLSATLVVVKVALISLSGSISSISGAVTTAQHQFGVNVSGAISSVSGGISKLIMKPLSGSITAAGVTRSRGTFRSAIMKAGTVIRKIIPGGREA